MSQPIRCNFGDNSCPNEWEAVFRPIDPRSGQQLSLGACSAHKGSVQTDLTNWLLQPMLRADAGFLSSPHMPPGTTFGSGGNVLRPGQQLNKGESLHSLSKKYHFTMQADGNLVLYYGDNHNPASMKPLWASNTAGRPASHVVMQTDSNLVVYSDDKQPHWACGTNGHGAPGAYAIMQEDGNLVVYDGKHNPIWATGTNGRS
eukprot:m.111450 g.111450  ORF g.111450 m.111450 type:complete len:202 (-) comp9089_c0_seq2:67-672(-)